MAALNDGLAGGTGQLFEDEGVTRRGRINAKVVVPLEPDDVRGRTVVSGTATWMSAWVGLLIDLLVLFRGDQEHLFNEVFRAVLFDERFDERHDEIGLGFGRGISHREAGAFAGAYCSISRDRAE